VGWLEGVRVEVGLVLGAMVYREPIVGPRVGALVVAPRVEAVVVDAYMLIPMLETFDINDEYKNK